MMMATEDGQGGCVSEKQKKMAARDIFLLLLPETTREEFKNTWSTTRRVCSDFLVSQWPALALWCVGTTVLVLLTQGQLHYEFTVEWTRQHGSKGESSFAAQWPLRRRAPPRCAFFFESIVCATHASTDDLRSPSKVAIFSASSGHERHTYSLEGRVLALSVNAEVVVVLRADGRVICLTNNLTAVLWSVGPFFSDDDHRSAIAIVEDEVWLALEGRTTRLAVVALETGATLSTHNVSEKKETDDADLGFLSDAVTEGPQPKPSNVWTANPRFWSATTYDDEPFSRLASPSIFIPNEESILAGPWRGELVFSSLAEHATSLRTRTGLAVFYSNHSGFASSPPGALVGDFDCDGTLDTVKTIDSEVPAPRTKNGQELPVCSFLGTRGIPPVEQTLQLSLCHLGNLDREISARRRRPRKQIIYSASPIVLEKRTFTDVGRVNRQAANHNKTTPYFQERLNLLLLGRTHEGACEAKHLLFSVSRGATALVDAATGRHRWLVRGTPVWSNPGGGHALSLRDDTLAIVAGQTTLALLGTNDGSLLADLQLPLLWDDELLLREPLLIEDEDPLLIVTTQFQSITIRLKTTLHGRIALRIIIFLACVALPVFINLLFDEEDIIVDQKISPPPEAMNQLKTEGEDTVAAKKHRRRRRVA